MGRIFAYPFMKSLCVLALAAAAFAQRGVPPAVYHAPQKEQGAPPAARMQLRPAPERWMGPVTAQEQESGRVRAGLTQISLHRAVTPADVEGAWQTMRDGTAVWRLMLRSPGAVGMRLHIQDFHEGDGTLWVTETGAGERQTFGPYSRGGVHGDGEFWTSTALGEAVLIEYETRSRSRSLPFRIVEISHLTNLPVEQAKPAPDFGLAKAGEGRAAALSCNIDVNCRPEYAPLARAVARISFETSEGGALCSGTVVGTRNNSFIPYFLTAAHCISSDVEARTVEAFFLYQSQSCGGPPPAASSVKRSLGARYEAGSAVGAGDFTLLRLTSVPDGTTFAGWTPDEHPLGTAVTGIHHPTGDLKKISFGQRGDFVATRGRPEANFYTVLWREGVTEGGSSGSGIFNDQGQLVGMLSGGPRPPAGQTECDLRPAFDWYGRFDVAYPQIRSLLEDRADGGSTRGGTTNPATGMELTSGMPVRITLPAAANSTLYSGVQGYRIMVPEGATELELRLTTATANADLDLFASFGADPSIASGRVRSDYSSTGDTGNERIQIKAQSNPPLKAGTYFVAIASFTTGQEIAATLEARIATGTGGGGGSAAVTLVSGVARQFQLPAVTGGTLFGGSAGYQITVPEGATQLQIRVNTATANADVDLFARFGSEVRVENGRVLADYRSAGDTGNELITINAQSTPPLRAGTYFIGLGLFTSGVAVTGNVTATVSSTPAGMGGQPVVLSSGVARTVNLPATASPTLFAGDLAFQITVPEGATRLRIDLKSTTPGVDVDMFARYGQLSRVTNGHVESDFASEGPAGDESITISDGLKPGVYFIQFVNFTNTQAVAGTITATVERAFVAPSAPVTLTSGVPAKLALPAVDNPILFSGNYSYKIQVPEGATRMTIRLTTATPNADVDLYARYGADVTLSDEGEVVADFYSETQTGNEVIVLSPATDPVLRAGTYYISTALFTLGVPVTGSITATVERAPAATPELGRELRFDEAVRFSLPAAEGPVLYGGQYVYRVNVDQPGGLKFTLRTETPGVDVDLHVRFQQPPAIVNGRMAADFSATGDTGDEDLTVLPNLIGNRLGTYYVALSVYTPGVPVTGTLRVTQLLPGLSGDEKRAGEAIAKESEGGPVKQKLRLQEE